MIQETFIVISLALGAYVVGSVPTAYILVRWMGREDIRDVGSRNVGALNAYNRTGAWAGLLVLFMDTAKGVLAVAAPRLLGVDPWVLFITSPLVVVGHSWPVFLNFRGRGRGGHLRYLFGYRPLAHHHYRRAQYLGDAVASECCPWGHLWLHIVEYPALGHGAGR